MLGKHSVPGRPTNLVGAGGGCLDIFSLVCLFSFLFLPVWETAQYRLKYCLKGPLNPKQPTNQQPVWEQLATDQFLTAFFVVSYVGCLGVTGVLTSRLDSYSQKFCTHLLNRTTLETPKRRRPYNILRDYRIRNFSH